VQRDSVTLGLAASTRQGDDSEGGSMRMRVTRNLGMLLLGIWLILSGLLPMLHVGLGDLSIALQLLAIVAGALILIGR